MKPSSAFSVALFLPTALFASVRADVSGGYVVDDTLQAMYSCVVEAIWSAENHPVDYPSNAHLSTPVFISHSSEYTLFEEGEIVSPGVQVVAETGKTDLLENETIAAGDEVLSFIRGKPIWFTEQPGGIKEGHLLGRNQTLSEMLVVTPDQPYVSSITMLAPTPDWISGITAFEPIVDGKWLQEFSIETLPVDAGTDSGSNFTSENLPTDPLEPATTFSVDNNPTGIFVSPDGTEVRPVLRWVCSLNETVPKEMVEEETPEDDTSAGSWKFGVATAAVLAASATSLFF